MRTEVKVVVIKIVAQPLWDLPKMLLQMIHADCDDWPCLSKKLASALQGGEFHAFDIHLDQRWRLPCEQRIQGVGAHLCGSIGLNRGTRSFPICEAQNFCAVTD